MNPREGRGTTHPTLAKQFVWINVMPLKQIESKVSYLNARREPEPPVAILNRPLRVFIAIRESVRVQFQTSLT